MTLSDSDASGHSSLSPNSVSDSTTPVALNLDGHVVNLTVGSTLGGVEASFATSLATREYAIPSGTAASANAGTGTIVLGGDGAMWFGEQNGIGRVTTSGAITEFPMVQPQRLVLGPDGAVWFTTYYDSATGKTTRGRQEARARCIDAVIYAVIYNEHAAAPLKSRSSP